MVAAGGLCGTVGNDTGNPNSLSGWLRWAGALFFATGLVHCFVLVDWWVAIMC